MWRHMGDSGPAEQAFSLAATFAQNILPAADSDAAGQQAALDKLAANLGADATLFSAALRPLATVGAPLPAPEAGRETSGWVHYMKGPPVWVLKLPDGRWLMARLQRERTHPGLGFFGFLALIVLAVGVGAFPVVRTLTKRLERLQRGVESLGAGDLSARVRVEGRDEVADLAASFNRAAARIEELVSAHKSLLANASHELRTPLARIRMAIELTQGDADPKRRRDLETDIAELDALIEEILLVSRLDAGLDAANGIDAEEDVDLLALAAEECSRVDGAELDGEPATLHGDPKLLRRMIRNLLVNAQRHGAPPIEVAVKRVAEGVELSVRDHGPGIPEVDRERVFEPFFRRAGASQAGGAGLGLALVRQIAERHGGKARCEAPGDGQGSQFYVVLGSS
jgi:signal transduction histidine kinase